MNYTLAVLENEQEEFENLLTFLAGNNALDNFNAQTKIGHLKLDVVEEQTVHFHLNGILCQNDNVIIHWFRTTDEMTNFLNENNSNILLALLDIKLNGNDSLQIFDSLIKKEIPILIVSAYINTYWDKLHAKANGKYFQLLPKEMIKKALVERNENLDSLCKLVVGQVYLHPRFLIQNKLRKIFGETIFREEIIVNKLVSHFYPNLVETSETQGELEESTKSVQEYEKELLKEIRQNVSNFTTDKYNVFDEVSPLKAVIVHDPEEEIEKVQPENCEKYLFNQPVNFKKFKEQHTKFRKSLETVLEGTGKVYTIRKLLEDLIINERINPNYRSYLKSNLVVSLLKEMNNISDVWELLETPDNAFISILFSGEQKGKKYFNAIPNLVFTRDWGFTAHNKIFLSSMKEPARKREANLVHFLFKYHPLFLSLYDIGCSVKLSEDEDETVEGGDVLLATENTVLIGFSDRTKFGAIKKFARIAFDKLENLTTIIATTAPLLHPKSMHLDTFMGFFDRENLMLDQNTFSKKDQQPSFIFRKRKLGIDGEQPLDKTDDSEIYIQSYLGTFIECLNEYIQPKPSNDLNIIPVDEPNEQYDDALNVFTVAPNKVFIYERSHNTIKKLVEEHSWEIFRFKWITDSFGNPIEIESESRDKLKEVMKDKSKRVLFLVEGDELALARGGPHCMTFPISRG